MDKLSNSSIGKTFDKTFGTRLGEYASMDINSKEQNQLTLASNGSVDKILDAIRNAVNKKNVTARSSRFNATFNKLMNQNENFRQFMITGAGITPDEWEKNKSDILSAEGDVGAKMRKFLAYTINKSDIKQSSTIDPNDVKDTILKRFKTTEILPSTPLTPQEQEST